tara:strand:- start:500 stop:1207 length:708 start_codon:yes stop_codon:yes gene_type:complete
MYKVLVRLATISPPAVLFLQSAGELLIQGFAFGTFLIILWYFRMEDKSYQEHWINAKHEIPDVNNIKKIDINKDTENKLERRLQKWAQVKKEQFNEEFNSGDLNSEKLDSLRQRVDDLVYSAMEEIRDIIETAKQRGFGDQATYFKDDESKFFVERISDFREDGKALFKVAGGEIKKGVTVLLIDEEEAILKCGCGNEIELDKNDFIGLPDNGKYIGDKIICQNCESELKLGTIE